MRPSPHRPTRAIAHRLALLSTLGALACAPAAVVRSAPSPDTAELVELQRRWWRALVTGDTATLNARTANPFVLTLSSGRTLDRASMLAEAATFAGRTPATSGWSEESVQELAPGVAIARMRGTEAVALVSDAYRFATSFTHDGTAWRVATFTRRVDAAAAGPMTDYVGEYRGPLGGVVRVVARDSVLGLVEPSGREIRLEPIGPSLFEFDYIMPAGVILRMAFARDAGGRVTSMSRLIPGTVNTFVRLP